MTLTVKVRLLNLTKIAIHLLFKMDIFDLYWDKIPHNYDIKEGQFEFSMYELELKMTFDCQGQGIELNLGSLFFKFLERFN